MNPIRKISEWCNADPGNMFLATVAFNGLAFVALVSFFPRNYQEPNKGATATVVERVSATSFKEEAISSRAVIESGQILIQAQQDLIAALEVQLVIVREERDQLKKLANPTGLQPYTNKP